MRRFSFRQGDRTPHVQSGKPQKRNAARETTDEDKRTRHTPAESTEAATGRRRHRSRQNSHAHPQRDRRGTGGSEAGTADHPQRTPQRNTNANEQNRRKPEADGRGDTRKPDRRHP